MTKSDDSAGPRTPDVRPFASVVEALSRASEPLLRGWQTEPGRHVLPSPGAIAVIVEDLRAVLFPGYFGASDLATSSLRNHLGATLEKAQIALTEQIRRALLLTCAHDERDADCRGCARRAADVTAAAVLRLPAIRALLETDVKAAYDGDPAATSADETLLCYPGVAAIIQHRIAHELYALSVPLIPRLISELAHGATGIDIHPGADIGGTFFIDHGTGVVIGETCTIGRNVRIYQSVTLGARGFPTDDSGHPEKGRPRHPIVEDDVVIYAGATILGHVTIGKGATIGGNVWLTHSVPPGCRVTQAQLRHETFEQGAGI